jgi:hypothetical protein
MKELYSYDQMSCTFKPVTNKVVSVFGISLLAIIISIGFTSKNLEHSIFEPFIIHMNSDTGEAFSEARLYNTLRELRVQHPDIVLAQAKLETGNFKSVIFRNNNNLFGMKVCTSRPTTNTGMELNHAKYKSWRDSVLDYAMWQASYGRNLSRNEYLQLLESIYAEDGAYVHKLQKHLVRVN